jgi:hypothetical protein
LFVKKLSAGKINRLIKLLGMKKMRTDFLVVVGMVLLFIPIILFFEARFLTSTILLFAIPAVYLLIRKPIQIKKTIYVLAVGMMGAFSIDFLAEINGAWAWAPEGQLLFQNKLFGLIPIDVLIWYFFWILLTIVYYEHFFEHNKTNKISHLFKIVSAIFFAIMVLIIAVFYINPDLLIFPYAYTYIGVVGSLPFFYVIFKKPRLIGKLLKAGIFSTFLFLSFELTALVLDQWRFPGQYIGHIQLFGLQFPFEEFVFWILFGTPIVLSYYELFVDDGK